MLAYPSITERFNRRRFLQLAGGSATALALSACVPANMPAAESAPSAVQEGTAQSGGVLRVAFPGSPQQLDPMMITNFEEVNLGRALYDCLVDIDHELTLQPGLATAWEANADGTSWTFTLREGVTFTTARP